MIDAGRGTGANGRGYEESGDRPLVGERERDRERDRSQTEQSNGDAGSILKRLLGGCCLNVTGERVLVVRVRVAVTRLGRFWADGEVLVLLWVECFFGDFVNRTGGDELPTNESRKWYCCGGGDKACETKHPKQIVKRLFMFESDVHLPWTSLELL